MWGMPSRTSSESLKKTANAGIKNGDGMTLLYQVGAALEGIPGVSFSNT
jgi:succinate dehydrogenase/fumarate reductase flavoprotein subunit